MLVAITLLCVILSLWVAPAERQRRTVAAIETMGGSVDYVPLLSLQRLTGLKTLGLNDTQVTDAGLVHLQGLTGLRWLDLAKTKATDSGPAKLRQALPRCKIGGL